MQSALPTPKPPAPGSARDPKLRKAFDAFVGEALFGQMLKGMRKTLGKPAYFYGGRTEEIFQQQLDQVLAEKLSDASAEKLSGPMFELFTLERK
jgi:Rod binding domain-containing protein